MSSWCFFFLGGFDFLTIFAANYKTNFHLAVIFNNTMTKHIVTFQLTGTPQERVEVARRFKAALEALPEQIDVLQSIEVGINENPAEQWDVVLTAVVPTLADVETYAKHPAHVAAAALLSGHKANRACVDYDY